MLERAANRAQSLGAPSEALRLMESALALGPDPASAARLHRAACAAANDAAQPARGIEHGTAAVALYEELGAAPKPAWRRPDRPLLPRQRRHAARHRPARGPLGPPGRSPGADPEVLLRVARNCRPPTRTAASSGVPPLSRSGTAPRRTHRGSGGSRRRLRRPGPAVHRKAGPLHWLRADPGGGGRRPPARLRPVMSRALMNLALEERPATYRAGRAEPRGPRGRPQDRRRRVQGRRCREPRPRPVDQRGVGRPRGLAGGGRGPLARSHPHADALRPAGLARQPRGSAPRPRTSCTRSATASSDLRGRPTTPCWSPASRVTSARPPHREPTRCATPWGGKASATTSCTVASGRPGGDPAREFDLATELLGHVADEPPALLTPALAAHLPCLRALLGAARGDDPQGGGGRPAPRGRSHGRVRRRAYAARAQHALGQWLADQARADHAEPWLELARVAYQRLGATAWLRGRPLEGHRGRPLMGRIGKAVRETGVPSVARRSASA